MLNEIRKELNNIILEREYHIDVILAALASKEHVFLLGPPGNAKTMLATELAKRFQASSFIYLMSKESRTEEVFGPFRLTKLKEDVYERNITGKMADSQIVLLDEIWKGGQMMNSFLTAINEREFDNNGRIKIPLHTLICCSNEIPEDSSLNALYDRMLFRLEVDYLVDNENVMRLMFGDIQNVVENTMSLDKLHQDFLEARKRLTFPKEIQENWVSFIHDLRRAGIAFSDRRAKSCIKGMQALYYVRGEQQMDSDIFYWCADSIWYEPAEKIKIINIGKKYLRSASRNSIDYLDAFNRIRAKLQNGELDKGTGNAELKEIINKIKEEFSNAEDHTSVFKDLVAKIEKFRTRLLLEL